MAEGYLKVTPEKLIQAANEFSVSGKTISSLTSEMTGIVNSLKGVWQGEAALAYSNKFNSLQDDIDKINKIIQNHVLDLTTMAKEYETAEQQNNEESASLLSDIIN